MSCFASCPPRAERGDTNAQYHLFLSQSTNDTKVTTTNLKWRLQVILVSDREVFHSPQFLHRLHPWTGLLEVPDVLGISPLPTTAVLTGIGP